MATTPARSATDSGKRLSACVAAAKALDDALRGQLQPIPDGWFSRQMFQDSQGLGKHTAKERIQRMKRLGIVEAKTWKTETGTVPIYRVTR